MRKTGILIIILASSTVFAKDQCKSYEAAIPRFSKFLAKKKKDFIKEYGVFRLKPISEIACRKLSEGSNKRIFEWKEMIPYYIDHDCIARFGDNSKKYAPQQVMADNLKIVGGGSIACTTSGDVKNYYVSNYSKRYCFDFKVVTEAVKSLVHDGIKLKNIHVKYNLKKFCKVAKDSTKKKRDIIASRDYSFGYKKSHVYRGDQFLRLISSLKSD